MPLGWDVLVDTEPPAPEGGAPAPHGDRIARWFAVAAHDWLDRLVGEGAARFLGGNGYPSRYRVRVRDLLPHADHAAAAVAARCGPDEWVALEVWDAS